jgi:hypothetical protein
MKRPKKSNSLGETIPMASIDAADLLRAERPLKKEVDALAQELTKEGLIYPLVVLEKGIEPGATTYGKYVLLAGRKRFLAAQKLDWPKILAIAIPKVKKDLEKRVVEMIELTRKNKVSDYDLAELGCALEQDLFKSIFHLSPGYAYNLIRWFRRSIPEVKKAWKESDPLVNQQELERMIKMKPEEAREYWKRRQVTNGLPGESFQPGKSQGKQLKKIKQATRATSDQLWKLLQAIMGAPLAQPVRGLCFGITHFALGTKKEVPGILTAEGGKTDYDNLDPLLLDEKQKKAF